MQQDDQLNLVSFDELLSKELENKELKEKFEQEYLKITLINETAKIRKDMNLTQKEMAKIVGVPQSNISRFESGKVEPTLDFLQKITSRLGYRINISIEKI